MKSPKPYKLLQMKSSNLWLDYIDGLVANLGPHYYTNSKITTHWLGFVQCHCYNDLIPGALARIHDNYITMLDVRCAVNPDKTWRKDYEELGFNQQLRAGIFDQISAADPDFETKFDRIFEYHELIKKYLGIKEDGPVPNHGMMADAARA